MWTPAPTAHGDGGERADLSEARFLKSRRIYTGVTVVEYPLAAIGPGGGTAVVPGSHKANPLSQSHQTVGKCDGRRQRMQPGLRRRRRPSDAVLGPLTWIPLTLTPAASPPVFTPSSTSRCEQPANSEVCTIVNSPLLGMARRRMDELIGVKAGDLGSKPTDHAYVIARLQ